MNNTFSISRFTLLFRQSWLHNNRLIWLALTGYCGLVVILLLLFQASQDFKLYSVATYQVLFVIIFIAGGVICAGSSFTAFRSKEKTYSYLMIPASAEEKFAVEFILRVILFVVLVPVLFYVIYILEGTLLKALVDGYDPKSSSVFEFPSLPDYPKDMKGTWVVFFIALLSLIFIIPFTGSAAFAKSPLIKTMFMLAILIIINGLLIYFFAEIVEFKNYQPSGKGLLFIHSPETALTAGTLFVTLMDIGLLTGAYFKLKEKEA